MALTVSATDVEVPKPVNVAYNETLLRTARPLAAYYIGAQPGELMLHRGTATIGWRRFNTSADDSSAIAPTVTPLSEVTTAAYGMGRTPATVHRTDTSATVSKYGQFFYVNEEVDVFNFNHTMDGIVQTLAISAGRSLNWLQRNVLEDNLTLHYAGNVASAGAVTATVSAGDLNYAINVMTRNYVNTFSPVSAGSQIVGSSPLLPSLWGLCHPDVAHDIAGLTGFKSAETYASHTALVPGEFGFYGRAGLGVRFIQTPEASIDAGAGATTSSNDFRSTSGSNDLYTIVLLGRDAHGAVGLGQQLPDGSFVSGREGNPPAIKMIVKGRNTDRPSGLDDPFDEMMSMAWSAWHAGAILNSNWGRGLVVAASNLAN